MAKFVKVILFLLLTVAFHSIAGNVSTAKVVDEQERVITYAMRQHGEISAPDLPGKPVAELNNLQSHQISVTRIQRVQLGEYFFSLKNACRGVQTVITHCHSIGEGFIILQLPIIASHQVNTMYIL